MGNISRLMNNWDIYYIIRPLHANAITVKYSGWTSIQLNNVWETAQLTAIVYPTWAIEQPVWSSSNTSVATVNQSWLVTCVTPWSCTITATINSVDPNWNPIVITSSISVYAIRYIDFMLVWWGGWWGWGFRISNTLVRWWWWWAWWVWENSGVWIKVWEYCIIVGAWGYKCEFETNSRWCWGPSRICWNWVNYAVCWWWEWWWALRICTGSWGTTIYQASFWWGWGSWWWWEWYSCSAIEVRGGEHMWCWLWNSWWCWRCSSTSSRWWWGGWWAWWCWKPAVTAAWWFWWIWICTNFFGNVKCIAGWGNWSGNCACDWKMTNDNSCTSATYWGWCWANSTWTWWDATTYGWWWWWSWYPWSTGAKAGGKWYQWIVWVRYPKSCNYNMTWWTKYACNIWWVCYCVHCFTSDWTLTVN